MRSSLAPFVCGAGVVAAASDLGSPFVVSAVVSVMSTTGDSSAGVSSVKPAKAFCTKPEVVFSKNEERSSRSRSPSPDPLGIDSWLATSLSSAETPSFSPISVMDASSVRTCAEKLFRTSPGGNFSFRAAGCFTLSSSSITSFRALAKVNSSCREADIGSPAGDSSSPSSIVVCTTRATSSIDNPSPSFIKVSIVL